MDRAEIEKVIPHRAPFLWIDEVVEISDSRIHARKKLDPDLDVFKGHYPDFPVLPGVLQCEAALQAGAVLIAQHIQTAEGEVPVATRLTDTKFRRLVRPGETLDIEVELTETLGRAYYLTGRISVDGQVSTRLNFACSAAPIGDSA